jgi:peptide-methionine (S)-S-oxide reductase
MDRIFAALLALLGATAAAPSAPVSPFPPPAIGAQLAHAPSRATAVLAGGCFWGMEAVFESLRGVSSVVSGFAGGAAQTAHYEMVSTGMTGHAESVEITYDPSQISYGTLLQVYFSVAHDPTQLDRQGPDEGTQYRSAIFFANDEQKRIAQAYIKQLEAAKVFSRPIVTTLEPLHGFYAAEAYHQNYLRQHPDQPYIAYNDIPKLRALAKTYPQLEKPNLPQY